MSLLVRIARFPDEGPSGFRLRLACANMLSFRELVALEEVGEVVVHDHLEAEPSNLQFNPWVYRWARFCPQCLGSRRIWLLGWELTFADACTTCGGWLVDTCSACNARLTWHRARLLYCDCGQTLASESMRPAPIALLQLSTALQSIAMGACRSELRMLAGLNLQQAGRLIRLLGTYGHTDGRQLPQRVSQIDTLEISWPISTMAAEVLASWPNSLTRLLDGLRRQCPSADRGRLTRAFGGFYTSLYRGFKEPQFKFLRDEFETYIAFHWTGAMDKRDRRLDRVVLPAMAWVSAKQACLSLRISKRRLDDLISESQVAADRRVTAGNREVTVVLRADVERFAADSRLGLTLEEVAKRLGLKRQRLSLLLPILCPTAQKLGEFGCPWSIPLDWVSTWEILIRGQKAIVAIDESLVSLGHVIRYWPWTDLQVARMLNAVLAGELVCLGVQSSVNGLCSLVLPAATLRSWLSQANNTSVEYLTLPEAAKRMGVKQEVAYALARSNLLKTTTGRAGRRAERRVTEAALTSFDMTYVFCREIAHRMDRSPRAISGFLATQGIQPVAGPGVDGCRQLVYRRIDVRAILVSVQ